MKGRGKGKGREGGEGGEREWMGRGFQGKGRIVHLLKKR